jgi:hypothetical protein
MKQKVEAIFDLRAAAEAHARAEVAVEQAPTPAKKDKLLDAKVALGEATQDAIEACEHCSLPHGKNDSCKVLEFPQTQDEPRV